MIKSANGRKAIYIDAENKDSIINYIKQDKRHSKKFHYIATAILEGHKIPELYDKEDINSKTLDVTAMKFFKGQENDRIYCKEVKTQKGVFVVIACVLHERKKSKKLTNKEENIINNIGSYEYDI